MASRLTPSLFEKLCEKLWQKPLKEQIYGDQVIRITIQAFKKKAWLLCPQGTFESNHTKIKSWCLILFTNEQDKSRDLPTQKTKSRLRKFV